MILLVTLLLTQTSSSPITFTGRVVDERRFPVAGAAVMLKLMGLADRAAITGPDGSFAIVSEPPDPTRTREGSLVAASGAFVGARIAYLQSDDVRRKWAARDRSDLVQVGAIVMRPAHDLVVRVVRDDQPIAGVRVRAEWSEKRLVVADGFTDASGRMTFTRLPAGDVVLIAMHDDRRGRANVVVPSSVVADVVLEPTWELSARVIDAATSRPLPGVVITLREETRDHGGHRPSLEGHLSTRDLFAAVSAPDAHGYVHACGLGRDQKIVVRVAAEGYKSLTGGLSFTHYPNDFKDAEADRDRPSVEIDLFPIPRRLADRSWPIEHVECGGELRDGSVQFRGYWGPFALTGKEVGRIAGGEFLGGDLDPHAAYVLVAPDGCLAELREKRPDAVVFRKPRRLEVVIVDDRGQPVAGALVIVASSRRRFLGWDGGPELIEPVMTDAAGRAICASILPRLVEVQVAPPGAMRHPIALAEVDLRERDGAITCTLPTPLDASLRVRIAGERRLPGEYQLSCDNHVPIEVLSEDPSRGEICCRIYRGSMDAPLSLSLLAPGHRSHAQTVPRSSDGLVAIELDL